MSNLLIIGAGGHGIVVAEAAIANGRWKRIAFLDDRYRELNGTLPFPVLGALAAAEGLKKEYADAAVAVGDSSLRLLLIEQLLAQGFSLPPIVHPTAWISPSAQLAPGCVVMAQAVLQANVRLGRGAIINTAATVDHDCRIGDGVHVCPGVNLAGEVEIGSSSWIGIGSCAIQQIKIGANVTIGAGAAVVTHIGDNSLAVGVPAKVVRKPV